MCGPTKCCPSCRKKETNVCGLASSLARLLACCAALARTQFCVYFYSFWEPRESVACLIDIYLNSDFFTALRHGLFGALQMYRISLSLNVRGLHDCTNFDSIVSPRLFAVSSGRVLKDTHTWNLRTNLHYNRVLPNKFLVFIHI